MRRWAIPALIVLIATTVTACSATTAPRTDLLEARRFGFRLILENRTNEPVYYFAVESRTSALIDWSPCTDPARSECRRVPAGGTVSIPYSDIYGYERGATEAVIHHWHLMVVGAAAGWAVTDMRFLRVRLR
jgi:hypothetical protein